MIWTIPSQGGVHGAGRSIGLSGHSFPGPDVHVNKSGNIPGPNADDTFSFQIASEKLKHKPVLKQCRKEEANSDEYEAEPEDEDEKETRELNGIPDQRKKLETNAEQFL